MKFKFANIIVLIVFILSMLSNRIRNFIHSAVPTKQIKRSGQFSLSLRLMNKECSTKPHIGDHWEGPYGVMVSNSVTLIIAGDGYNVRGKNKKETEWRNSSCVRLIDENIYLSTYAELKNGIYYYKQNASILDNWFRYHDMPTKIYADKSVGMKMGELIDKLCELFKYYAFEKFGLHDIMVSIPNIIVKMMTGIAVGIGFIRWTNDIWNIFILFIQSSRNISSFRFFDIVYNSGNDNSFVI